MKVNTRMTKSRVLGFIIGLKEESITVTGTEASSMD